MDEKNDGAAKQAKGSIKEAIGVLTGNPVVEAEGAAEKAAGKAQHATAHRGKKPRDG